MGTRMRKYDPDRILWLLKLQDAISSDSQKDDSKAKAKEMVQQKGQCCAGTFWVSNMPSAHTVDALAVCTLYMVPVSSSHTAKGDKGCKTAPDILPRNLSPMHQNKCSQRKHLWS
jgi:hypothetical protein